MGFYPDQTGQLANPFLKGFLRSQFFDPPVQPFQLIAEAAAGKKIFIQGFLMQPIRLQGFQPFPVCLSIYFWWPYSGSHGADRKRKSAV